MVTTRYYPPLSDIANEEDLPEILGFIKDGIESLFKNTYYKNLQYSKNTRGDADYKVQINDLFS